MRIRKDDETLSLFDVVEPKEITGPKVDVVRLDYVTAEPMTWQELFEGYQKLRAITFSSGINFVYNLLDMFEDAEIIFGCESVMSYSIQEIMAYQNQLLERMREAASNSRQKLLDRIDNGSVRFFVAHDQLSHEKIYLLEAEDGKILKQVPGKPVYTATLVKYAELICDKPLAQGKIMGVGEE